MSGAAIFSGERGWIRKVARMGYTLFYRRNILECRIKCLKIFVDEMDKLIEDRVEYLYWGGSCMVAVWGPATIIYGLDIIGLVLRVHI